MSWRQWSGLRAASRVGGALALGLALVGGALPLALQAQPVAAPAKASAKAAANPPSARPASPAKAPASPASPAPADEGYRFGPQPAWVQEPPAAKEAPRGTAAGATASTTKARRDLLVDMQVHLGGKVPVTFLRLQKQALDSSTLREVSEPQISFNPLYQRLVIHDVQVLRDGRRSDRRKNLRVEMMRREQQLERQMIDGLRTALVMLSDVRVGDVVEMAYSIEGENPIFEGRFSELFQLAGDAPIDRLHLRIDAPAARPLQTRGVPAEVPVERLELPGRQVLRVVREQVAPVLEEAGTPPWFKVYPALHVSEYRDWAEVDQWARRLFATEAPDAELAQRIAAWKARGLAPEALVAEVLRFVQDEVRYFSVSLGESSHRPKPASRTLAERLGDCKDKVLLLNTLLTGLGFEARPALVSMHRNRGVSAYLPSHDQFDHVITRLDLAGQVFYLDPTMNGQGLGLRERGYYPYGQALVVGAGQGPQAVALPDFVQDSVSYRQEWDLSDLKQPARMDARMVLRGLSAERWRASFAAAGLDRIAENLAGAYVRQMPGLKPATAPELLDSRETNELELRLHFEQAKPGRYEGGLLHVELSAMELADMLSLPPEARRRTPFMLDTPRLTEHRLVLKAPRPLGFAAPAPQQVADRNFLFSLRSEISGNQLLNLIRLERRGDEVLPAELDGYRERVQKMRHLTGNQLRLSLVDIKALEPSFPAVDQRLASFGLARGDALLKILQMQEFIRLRSSQVLGQTGMQGPLSATVLADRAMANNLLGAFNAGLSDASMALALDEQNADALEARGVALVGLNRLDDAVADFERLSRLDTRTSPGSWLGIAQYQQGRFDQAERSLRAQVEGSIGDERDFSLMWLYLATERHRAGQGQAVLAPHLAGLDTAKWSSSLLRYLGGQLSQDELLKAAKAQPDQERLRMAEACFFIGQQLLAQGKPAEARGWFERTVATRAVPYREVTLAQLELRRTVATP